MSLASDRLDRTIAEERVARKPCPDLLAHLETLRGQDDGAINRALNELDGEPPMHFIGYHIDDCGEGVPVSTGATKEAAMTKAIQRVLGLGISFGEIGAQHRDLTDSEFASLTKTLDDWFAAKGVQ